MTNSLNGIMYTGKSALLTQQLAISVTGQNIANVNTEGYSRQEVELATNFPVSTSAGLVGTGVKAVEIQRAYDRFLAAQINDESTARGRWEARSGSLQQLENIFNESENYGLGQAMSKFWSAWQDVSNNPEGQAERMVLIEKGESLAAVFQSVCQDVKEVRSDADGHIEVTLDEINDITAQIADLNSKIKAVEITGQNANDYRDSRDMLLNGLSELIDIQVTENEDGTLAVNTTTGRSLVLGEKSWTLTSEPDLTDPGMHTISWKNSDGTLVDITDEISGGMLKGWLEVRDEVVPGVLSSLDDLANNLVLEVNTLHSVGYGLVDTSTGNPYQGNDFFDAATTGAADMSLDSIVAGNTDAIAASATLSGVPGDSNNAIAIADLQNSSTMGGSATFGEYYAGLVATVGSDADEANTWYDYQLQLETQLKESRESVSGVAIDEEMVNLVQFQHSYEAAAKLISTIDEMMQTVLQMV